MNPTKIYYDANFAVNQHRGMGKYINNFINILNKETDNDCVGLLKGNIKVEGNYSFFGFNNYVFWEQLSLLRFMLKNSGPIIFPYNTAPLFVKKSKLNVLIVHDLIYMGDFQAISVKQKIGALYRRFLVPRIIKKFDHIVTVSEYSKKEIVQMFQLSPEKITVIQNAVTVPSDQFVNNPDLDSRENYFFHIGGEPKYKNSLALLYAFAILPQDIKSVYKLKIVGINNAKTRAKFEVIAKKNGILNQVEFLPYQTNEEIELLYKHAKLFVFPSIIEGFGIPIIESFKYGCPLVCSDTSCFPEIAGDAATYFNPLDHSSIANAIIEVLMNDFNTIEKVKKGYQQIENYTIENFQSRVLSWYKKYQNN